MNDHEVRVVLYRLLEKLDVWCDYYPEMEGRILELADYPRKVFTAPPQGAHETV